MSKERLARAEVTALLEIDEAFVETLEREGIVHPSDDGTFTSIEVERIRISRTLLVDLGVNVEGAEVALYLLETIHAQRRQLDETLRWLHTRLAER